MTAASAAAVALTIPVGVALGANPDGVRLNRAVTSWRVPVFIDPDLDRLGRVDVGYGSSIRLREWNQQVLLHEVVHVILDGILNQLGVTDEADIHKVITAVEVGLAPFVRFPEERES